MMRNCYLVLSIVIVFFSCSTEKKKEKEEFEIYQKSELATLMEEMYVFNDSLKNQILNGQSLSEIPYDLQQLYTTQMTDRFERDANFDQFAEVFKNYQVKLYSTSLDSLKMVYNYTIQSCIACHQTSCTGPLPRIQKLLIN